MDHLVLSPDEAENLLLSCRYGDVDDLKSFIDRFGTVPISEARDENGNTVLHMACANGHIGESIQRRMHPQILGRAPQNCLMCSFPSFRHLSSPRRTAPGPPHFIGPHSTPSSPPLVLSSSILLA